MANLVGDAQSKEKRKRTTIYVKPHKWECTKDRKTKDKKNDDEVFEIRAWGLTRESDPVLVRFLYNAPLIIELDPEYKWDQASATRIYDRLSNLTKGAKPVGWEFLPNNRPLYSAYLRTGNLIKMRFDSWSGLESMKWLLSEHKNKQGQITNPNGIVLWEGRAPMKLTVRNEKVDPDIAMLSEYGMSHTSWFEFEGKTVTKGRISRIDQEYIVNPNTIRVTDEAICSSWNPKTKDLIFDAEAFAERNTSMPKWSNPADAAFCVGVLLRQRDGTQEMHAFCSEKRPATPNGVVIHFYEDEVDAIKAYAEFIRDTQPDLIVTHNGLGWDEEYLWLRLTRAQMKWPNDSRLLNFIPSLIKKEWDSSAYSGMRFYWIDRPGVLHIDLLPWSKRSLNRLDSYKLGYLDKKFGGAGKLLGDEDKAKVDLDQGDDEGEEDYLEAHRIFEYYARGDPEELKRIVIYCVGCINENNEMVRGDCGITLRLLDKLQVWMSLTQMANVAFIQPFDVLTRGMQARTYNQVSKEACKRNMYMTKDAPPRIPVKGAHVFPPQRGVWDWVFVFDFKGLYPSIIRKYNLCLTTYVPELGDPNYDPGYDDPNSSKYVSDDRCHVFEWEETWHTDEYDEWKQGKKKSTKKKYKGDIMIIKHRHRVLKEPRGILPDNLDKLANDRELAKDEMKKFPKDSHEYAMKDKKQDAIKLVMNSAYGGLGSETGPLKCHPLAAIVTYVARCSAQKMAKYFEDTYNATVVYGDSVTADTPILCRMNENGKHNVVYRTIDELGDGKWYESDHGGDKEECLPLVGLEVWTDKGFTPIKRVIRHKCHKPLKRVLTHTGVVDVTTDHSLLTPSGEKIKPTEVGVGQELLHSDLPPIVEDAKCTITENQAYAWGLFYAEGSCGRYDYEKWRVKYSWAISNLDTKVFERAIKGLEESEPQNTFRVLDTVESSKVYKLTAFGEVAQLVTKWRALFYDKDKYKKVPDEILSAPKNIRQAFWDGYYAGDGDNDKNGYVRCDNKGKIGAAGLFYLATSLGYPVSINTRKDKLDVYRLTCTRNGKIQRKNPNVIKKIEDLPEYTGYVYDLETDNHHFSAGVGRMIVHNTDSAFIKFHPRYNNEIRENPHGWGKRMAKEGSALFEKPMELEFEKVFAWLLLVNKKQYVGPLIPPPDPKTGLTAPICWDLDKMVSRGLMFVKRGAAPIMQEMQKELALIALIEKAKGTPLRTRQNMAMEALERFCYRMMSHCVPEKELIITQKIGQNYKSEGHNLNVYRLHLVQEGKVVNPGDRIPYVFVKKGDGKKQGEKMELPELRKISHVPIDYLYYLEKRGVKPYDTVLEHGFGLTGYMKWRLKYLKRWEKIHEELTSRYADMVKVWGERNTLRLDVIARRERKSDRVVKMSGSVEKWFRCLLRKKGEFGASVIEEEL